MFPFRKSTAYITLPCVTALACDLILRMCALSKNETGNSNTNWRTMWCTLSKTTCPPCWTDAKFQKIINVTCMRDNFSQVQRRCPTCIFHLHRISLFVSVALCCIAWSTVFNGVVVPTFTYVMQVPLLYSWTLTKWKHELHWSDNWDKCEIELPSLTGTVFASAWVAHTIHYELWMRENAGTRSFCFYGTKYKVSIFDEDGFSICEKRK